MGTSNDTVWSAKIIGNQCEWLHINYEYCFFSGEQWMCERGQAVFFATVFKTAKVLLSHI